MKSLAMVLNVTGLGMILKIYFQLNYQYISFVFFVDSPFLVPSLDVCKKFFVCFSLLLDRS
jgi:hypothetical protein